MMSEQTGWVDEIRRLRDEARVKLHLASLDAKKEWDELEEKWRRFSNQAEFSRTGQGIDAAWRSLRDELAQGYQRVRRAVAPNQGSIDQDDGFRKRVSERAYHLWEGRGRPQGSADEDWYKAEQEVRRSG